MSTPTAVVLSAPGTNRDHDVAFALELAGAAPVIVSLIELAERPQVLDDAQLLVAAGGFSNADALGAGRMFAVSLQHAAGEGLQRFVAAGKPVIGICNGFQTLVRAGLLPGALGHNASGGFQCEWVTLQPQRSHCIWTRDVEPFDCPIAHGEGRYVHPDVAALEQAGQVALRYAQQPQRQCVVDRRGVRSERRGAGPDAAPREPRRRPAAPAARSRPTQLVGSAALRTRRRPRPEPVTNR